MADLVALLHGAFALFVMAGTVLIVSSLILGWRWVREPRFRTLHLGAVLFVALRSIASLPCPLTVLEDHLRSGPSDTALIRWAHAAALRDEDPERFARGSVVLAMVVLVLYYGEGASRRKRPAERPGVSRLWREGSLRLPSSSRSRRDSGRGRP